MIYRFMNYVTRARVTTRHYINTQRIEELLYNRRTAEEIANVV